MELLREYQGLGLKIILPDDGSSDFFRNFMLFKQYEAIKM